MRRSSSLSRRAHWSGSSPSMDPATLISWSSPPSTGVRSSPTRWSMRPSACRLIASRYWSTPTTPAPSASTGETDSRSPAKTSIPRRDVRCCGCSGMGKGPPCHFGRSGGFRTLDAAEKHANHQYDVSDGENVEYLRCVDDRHRNMRVMNQQRENRQHQRYDKHQDGGWRECKTAATKRHAYLPFAHAR